MNIFIVGFPYIRKEYRDTFREYPRNSRIFFLLPKRWPIKKGAVVFNATNESNIISTSAFFYRSDYPIVGGLLKGWMPLFPLYLLKKRKNIDLVYCCSEPILLATLYFSFWTKLFGKKLVIFSWENIPYGDKFHGASRLIHLIILNLNLLFCDGIICGNNKGEKILHQYTKKPVGVIPMSGLDVEFFQRNQTGKSFHGDNWSGKLVYVFAGAVSYRKGVHLILEAFSGVLKNIPTAKLIIAGSGEYEENIKAQIKNYKLEDFVVLIPWLNRGDLRELLNSADVFLYPSIAHGGWEEQFGYSMAEASLMELPVIATRSGSIGGVVVDDKSGILIEPNNLAELRGAMIRLGNDSLLRRQLGQFGRQYVARNFSYSIIADKFYKFFTGEIFKSK